MTDNQKLSEEERREKCLEEFEQDRKEAIREAVRWRIEKRRRVKEAKENGEYTEADYERDVAAYKAVIRRLGKER